MRNLNLFLITILLLLSILSIRIRFWQIRFVRKAFLSKNVTAISKECVVEYTFELEIA